ncbi:cytochrome b/b6 domain-containing protein [Micrococcoides hystricis]|uniref:Cytochrome b/b6 domain-containing protein n=1 Tax=Micrococcoides hystricis TaxID=1572761 RepID=A0ABV6P7Y6_9MICC
MPHNKRLLGIIVGAVAVLALAVAGSIMFLNSGAGQDFVGTYPGYAELPENTPTGFPAWLGWQHFFNFFLMALIIRTGIRVRTVQRPEAYWTPKPRKSRGGRGTKTGKKISIDLWFHQLLDVLWVLNGLIFVVLLFATGHWKRIIPTSWDVFPNALSAAMQYLSFNLPNVDAWYNYNSLQLLSYFTVVFVASPVAILTGLRTSEFWPKSAEGLNKVFPMQLARAVHWPTMIFFVAFIVVHVILVLVPDAKTQLAYMFAGTDQDTWLGVWLTIAAVAVTIGATLASRAALIAPLARLSGKVTRK